MINSAAIFLFSARSCFVLLTSSLRLRFFKRSFRIAHASLEPSHHPSVLFIPVIISLSQPAFSNCTKANQLLTGLQVDEVNRADRVRGIVDFTVAPTAQFSLAPPALAL